MYYKLFLCSLYAVYIYMLCVLQIHSNVTQSCISPACIKLLPAPLVSGNNLDIFQLPLKPQAVVVGIEQHQTILFLSVCQSEEMSDCPDPQRERPKIY